PPKSPVNFGFFVQLEEDCRAACDDYRARMQAPFSRHPSHVDCHGARDWSRRRGVHNFSGEATILIDRGVALRDPPRSSSGRSVMSQIEWRPGLADVPVAESAVSFIDGKRARLEYRGIAVEVLARQSSFEETAYLLLKGNLPTQRELADFDDRLRH